MLVSLEVALKAAPREPLVLYELAAFLVRERDDAPAAYKVVRHGLEIARHEPRLRLALARVLLAASAHAQRGLATEALATGKAALVAALRPAPGSAEAGDEAQQAWLLLSGGATESARQVVETAAGQAAGGRRVDGVSGIAGGGARPGCGMLHGGKVDEEDGGKSAAAEWWEGGGLWGIGLGVVAEKGGLMRAFDVTLEDVGREARVSAADDALESERRRIVRRYLPGVEVGAQGGKQGQAEGGMREEPFIGPGVDGRWGGWEDGHVGRVGGHDSSSSSGGELSSDADVVPVAEEGLTGWVQQQVGVGERRRRHLGINFEMAGRPVVGASAHGSAVGPGLVAKGGGNQGETSAGAAGGQQGDLDGKRGSVGDGLGGWEVPPVFPHDVPATLLQWVQSRGDWAAREEEGGGGSSGTRLGLMLDKAGLAAVEELAVSAAPELPETFDPSLLTHMVESASDSQRVAMLKRLISGWPLAWAPHQRSWGVLAVTAGLHQAAYNVSASERQRRRGLSCSHTRCGIVGCGGDSEPFWLFPRDRWATLVQVSPTVRSPSVLPDSLTIVLTCPEELVSAYPSIPPAPADDAPRARVGTWPRRRCRPAREWDNGVQDSGGGGTSARVRGAGVGRCSRRGRRWPGWCLHPQVAAKHGS